MCISVSTTFFLLTVVLNFILIKNLTTVTTVLVKLNYYTYWLLNLQKIKLVKQTLESNKYRHAVNIKKV